MTMFKHLQWLLLCLHEGKEEEAWNKGERKNFWNGRRK